MIKKMMVRVFTLVLFVSSVFLVHSPVSAEVFNKAETEDKIGIDQVMTKETKTYDVFVIQTGRSKKGTVILEVYPGKDSKWEPKKHKLNPTIQYLRRGYEETNISKYSSLKKDAEGKDYLEIKYFIDAPLNLHMWALRFHESRFGSEPFDIHFSFVRDTDLTMENGSVTKAKEVYWEGTKLVKGQVGKIKVLKSTNLWKRTDKGLEVIRVLKPGEQFRVYQYDQQYGGQYGVGGNAYISKVEGSIEYKTPSKAKLVELHFRH